MSMLILNDEHNKAFNGSGPVSYSGDFGTTPSTGLACLGDLGKTVMDWAFMNPWISVFIGLACVILFLAITMLILKCILRARFHSLSRHSSKCPHHHHHSRHHDRSPSFNAGTIVIDSSCNGDECIATSTGSGRNYLTTESKVPLLGKSKSSHNSLPRRGHHNQLAVVVSGDNDGDTRHRGLSPGSADSVGGSSSSGENNGKNGPLAASSNSTASSSAGAASLQRGNHGPLTPPPPSSMARVQQHNQVPTTFRTLQNHKHPGPPTAPRSNTSAMTHSWHAHAENNAVPTAVLVDDGNNNYHLSSNYSVQPEVPPPTYLYSIAANQQQNIMIRQPQYLHPAPHPSDDDNVVVKLLPALSAASSLAEFLGHDNDHIEVVPEGNEDEVTDDGSMNRLSDDDGVRVKSIDSDEEIDQRRTERREYMGALQQAMDDIDQDIDDEDIVDSTALPHSASFASNRQQSSESSSSENQQISGGNFVMSSSQNTAIFRPLATAATTSTSQQF